MLICIDNKRLHSCFLFKVNSSICYSCPSCYHAGVSPQKPPVSVTWQWVWEDSLTHLEAKDTTLANVCVHMHILFLTLTCLCSYQYIYKSVLCPLLGEVSNHIKHTSCTQQTHVTGIQLQGKTSSSSSPLPCLLSVLSVLESQGISKRPYHKREAEARLLWEPSP